VNHIRSEKRPATGDRFPSARLDRSKRDLQGFRSSESSIGAFDREQVTRVRLLQSDLKDGNYVNLNVQFVFTVDGELTECVGCRVFAGEGGDRKILTFKFDTSFSMPTSGEQAWELDANCKHVIAFPAVDGKMLVQLLGIKTCADKYGCPCCNCPIGTTKTETVLKYLPCWMEALLPREQVGEAGFEFKDFEPRVGPNAHNKCYENSKVLVGENGDKYATLQPKLNDKVKEELTWSVSIEPFYNNVEAKLLLKMVPGDPMHHMQGYHTHLTEATMKDLGEIDSGSSWSQEQEEKLKKEAEEIANLTESDAYMNAKRIDETNRKKVLKLMSARIKAEKKDDDELVAKIREAEDAAVADREVMSESTGFGLWNRKAKGAKEYIALLNDKKADKEKQKWTHAQYLFTTAIQMMAGRFNAQHGEMELTCGRGMTAMDHRAKIFEISCQAFPDEPEKRTRVKHVMEDWLYLAERLCTMGTISKSQKKCSPEKQQLLKQHTAEYGFNWRLLGRKPFWKMHMFESHSIPFILANGMMGLVSTEGFECKHFKCARQREMLKPIPKTEDRVQKLTQFQQRFLIPGLSKVLNVIRGQGKGSGKARGKYNRTATSRGIEEDANTKDATTEDAGAPGGYLVMDSGGILPNKFADSYNIRKKSEVPWEWTLPIRADDSIGTKAKAESKYI
jgi:hypothetical protein